MSCFRAIDVLALAAVALGVVGCVIGGIVDAPAFFRAWLCAYLLCIGVPLCGVTLVMVHDLSGGEWMATARPYLEAAAATMPLATLAGIPAFVDLHALYGWTHPAPSLNNHFYLNPTAFYVRYGIDVVLWNLLAAFALRGPRGGATPISPSLSWLSGLGLVVLALSVGFASIDWILSLEPAFWSSIFSYRAGAGWFNTGMALVLLTVAVTGDLGDERRGHMADLAAILFATTIFWAYAEFMQFLVIWEENIKHEIVWYLTRLMPAWQPALYVAVLFGFIVPFFALIWGPARRDRRVVATISLLMLLARVADTWWLVLPEFTPVGALWLNVAAILSLGGLIVLLFRWALRHPEAIRPGGLPVWRPGHG